MSEKFLLARDICKGLSGTATAVIEGQVVPLLELRNITATITKKKVSINTLGSTGAQHKTTGWEGTGSATAYYATSRWAKQLIEFTKTGKDLFFDINLTNEDPGTTIGKQVTLLERCNINGGDIAKFDVDADFLDMTFSFTFDACDMGDAFDELGSD